MAPPYGRPAFVARAAGRALRLTESFLLRRTRPAGSPQLFILGLPRSGTTLVYQYIVHRLHVAYFTNGVGRYPHSPCAITWLQHLFYGEYRSDFRSHYGKVAHALGPREAGALWARFFDLEAYCSQEQVSPQERELLRATIACVQGIYGGAPFVNKNVKHLLRIDPLAAIFPEACFLTIERDVRDVALSILRARHTQQKDPRQWWSVRPPNHAALGDLSAAEQVAGQISGLETRLAADLAAIDPARRIHCRYDDFCARPEELITRLAERLGARPTRNAPRASFDCAHNVPRTSDEEQLASRLVDREQPPDPAGNSR